MGTRGRVVLVLAALLLGTVALSPHAAAQGSDDLAGATDEGNLATAADTGHLGFGAEPSEPDHAGQPPNVSVWHKWTAPANLNVTISMCNTLNQFDTVLEVYSGPAQNPTYATIHSIAASDNDCGTGSLLSKVKFAATAGDTYYIVVDKVGASGGITYEWELGTAPPNDDFPGTLLPVASVTTVTGTNENATAEAGEPNHGGQPAGQSVWWTWTAPSDGTFTFQTCGSSSGFNTTLSVYTGGTFTGVTSVGENDDGCGGPTGASKLSVPVTHGTDYHIAVDGGAGLIQQKIGTITLDIRPTPANDDLANAVGVSTLPVSESVDNYAATAEQNENAHAGITATSSVWYRWTAPSDGTFIIDTCGSTPDSHLGIYNDGVGFPLVPASGQSTTACGTSSRVTLGGVTNGTVYLIAIDGSGGPVVLHINDSTDPTTTIDTSTIKQRRHKVIITFSGTVPTGTLSFECKLDNGVFSTCQSPFIKKKLRRGMHTFSVRATNGTLSDPTPATETFKIKR
jgi:hypothetical protein